MRTGHNAVGGSKCQRCGQTRPRGFALDVSKHGGDDTLGPLPWQQFYQVCLFVLAGKCNNGVLYSSSTPIVGVNRFFESTLFTLCLA